MSYWARLCGTLACRAAGDTDENAHTIIRRLACGLPGEVLEEVCRRHGQRVRLLHATPVEVLRVLKPRRTTRLFLALLCLLSIGTTTAATVAFGRTVPGGSNSLITMPLLALFGVLFLMISFGFWTATFGFICIIAGNRGSAPPLKWPNIDGPATARTAIVMPVYNEEPVSVFAGVAAMYEELQQTGQGTAFDFYILSDSTDPDIWLEEEAMWASLRTTLVGASGLFYRRRPSNVGRKSGNIQNFCQRWGSSYRYMIVLDADSLLAGQTAVEMVRRMEQDRSIGLLQTPPIPVNGRSMFARLQQFAASLYGDIFTAGLSLWSQTEGNYWGHNAIIRVEAFMDCCGLPLLPGRPPLGGEILSHDFVEAALLRKADWKVVMDHDLSGSYESSPANLIDFAQRDQRWCQGNLQHLRLTLVHGLRPVSRLHLGMGVMSYLSAPLWALLLMLAMVQGVGLQLGNRAAAAPPGHAAEFTGHRIAAWLFIATLALLLLPKLWALLLALCNRRRSSCFGGSAKVTLSVIVEALISAAIAPIFMMFQITFVVATLLGRVVRWEAQRRNATGISLHDAINCHAMHTITGLAGILAVQWLAPAMLFWTSPIFFGLIFSIPISLLLASARVGTYLRGKGLHLSPEEVNPPPILQRQRHYLSLCAAAMRGIPHPLVRVVADPALNTLHIALLRGEPSAQARFSPGELVRLRRVALSGGPAHLTKPERAAIVSDETTLRWLHSEAWKDWPPDLLERVAESAHRDCFVAAGQIPTA